MLDSFEFVLFASFECRSSKQWMLFGFCKVHVLQSSYNETMFRNGVDEYASESSDNV
jgi:hypothetical protein